jgi:hypothetical protein
MASCQECNNFVKRFGPTGSKYCKAFEAKIKDKQNTEGAEKFSNYFNSGENATNDCPNAQLGED